MTASNDQRKRYNEQARFRWHQRQAEMTDAERAEHKQKQAAYAKAWRAKTAGTSKHQARVQRQRAKYQADPSRAKAAATRSRLKSNYGLTLEQVEEMRVAQGNACYLCGTTSHKRLVVDHDHRTGVVRKLLCDRCNGGIGQLELLVERINPEHLLSYLHSGHRPTNPNFVNLLGRMREVNERKGHDYAGADPFSNFKDAAYVAGCSVDTVFAVLIGVKLARIRELSTGKTPKHESLADSRLDLSVYAALWASYPSHVRSDSTS